MFSVVIITLNESRNIERALLSVKGLTDDMVVVDSGSVDDTVALARKLGARVIERPWEGYSAAKNYGNSQAAYPWILSLDADEALSPELVFSIRQHVKEGIPECRVFMFNRLTNYCDRWIYHSGWYPDRKIRIWHRDFARWEGSIHEKVVFTEKPEMVYLKGDLYHYSYYSVKEHKKQIDLFTTLSAEDLFSKEKRAGYTRILFSPVAKFLRDYLFRLGFLDGWEGWKICSLSARAVYLKYVKLQRLWRATVRP